MSQKIYHRLLWLVLPSSIYHKLNFKRWKWLIYNKQFKVSKSNFLKPDVAIYAPEGIEVDTLKALSSLNTEKPTSLCPIMRWHGSDKGSWTRHNYTVIYDYLFSKFKNKKIHLFELGLGSNDVRFGANMGVTGRPGASLRAWRDYFSKALLFGADIDKKSLFSEERIKTYYCDQTDQEAISHMWSSINECNEFDIIIEDGMHTFDSSVTFFENSIGKLALGGLYIIEDIDKKYKNQWIDLLQNNYSKKYKNLSFAYVELKNKFNSYDNTLIVIHRHN